MPAVLKMFAPLGLAFALIVASGSTATAQTARGLPNPFYAMDTSMRDAGSIETKLDDLKQLGYAGLSWTGHDGNQVEHVARAAEQRGMKLYALYVGFQLQKDRLQGPDLTAVLKALKGRDTIIWVYITSNEFKPSDPRGDAVAVPALQALANQAATVNVRLAVYPHLGFWAERVQDGIRLAEKVQRPNFGVTFNLCHCLAVGDGDKIPELLTAARPHLFMVTINGADAGGRGWDKLIQTLDRGTFDVVPMLRTLRTLGYTGPIGFQGYGIAAPRKEILQRTMAGWQRVSAAAFGVR